MIFLLPRNFSPAFGFIRHKRLGERLSPVGTEVILYRFCSAVKSANGCFASAFITILGCVSARTLLFVAPPMRVVHDTIGIPITGACHLLNLSRNEIRTHRQSSVRSSSRSERARFWKRLAGGRHSSAAPALFRDTDLERIKQSRARLSLASAEASPGSSALRLPSWGRRPARTPIANGQDRD